MENGGSGCCRVRRLLGGVVVFNSNIYSNQMGPADIMGGVKDGFTIGQMIRTKKLRDKQEKEKESLKNIFKNNTSIGKDGKVAVDRKNTIAEMYQHNPEKALQYQKQYAQEEANKLKAIEGAARKKDEKILRDLSIKEKRRLLKEKGLPFEKTREGQKAAFMIKNKEKNAINADKTKSAGFAKRARQANQNLLDLPEDAGTGFFAGLNDYLPEGTKGEQRKLFEQSRNNFISAILRKESGAAISDEEYERETAKYFPQAGDTSKVLDQKLAAREQAMLNLEGGAGAAMDTIKTAKVPARKESPKTQLMSLPGINNAEAGDQIFKVQKQIKSMSREEKLKYIGR